MYGCVRFKVSFPLTHIFCGQINGKKAEGFHSRPDGEDPPYDSDSKCAKALEENIYHLMNHGFPGFKQISVYDAVEQIWINRSVRLEPNGKIEYYGFFPDDWNVTYVVTTISQCVSMCCSTKVQETECYKSNTLCLGNLQNESGKKFTAQVNLGNSPRNEHEPARTNKKKKKNGRKEMYIVNIVSTFPVTSCKSRLRCDCMSVND